MAHFQPYFITQNTLTTIDNPQPIAAVGGDNNTPFYLYFPQMPPGLQWVYPFVVGFLYPLPRPVQGGFLVDSTQTPALATAAPASTATANLTSYQVTDQPYTFDPGTPIPNNKTTSTAFGLAARGIGTYDFLVPTQSSAKGMILYFGISGGTGTATFAIQNTSPVFSPLLVVQELISAGFGNPSGGRILVYPGITAVNNVATNGVIGANPRIEVVVTVASLTFTVAYDLIP